MKPRMVLVSCTMFLKNRDKAMLGGNTGNEWIIPRYDKIGKQKCWNRCKPLARTEVVKRRGGHGKLDRHVSARNNPALAIRISK